MYQTILVLVDGSPTSDKGVDEAIRLALITKGRLRLFHVIDELTVAISMNARSDHAGNWLEQLRAGGCAVLEAARAATVHAGVEADTVLCEGFARTLHDLVAEEVASSGADLIVLGTHGRRGLDRVVLGSNAEQILRHAVIPVLLVRAAEEDVRTRAPNEPVHISLPSSALSFE